MRNYLLIFRHYFLRSVEPVAILLLTALPIVIIVILNMVYYTEGGENYYNGYNMVSTHVSMAMMIMFQLIGGNIVVDYLYADFRTARRWRLLSVPCALHVYIFSAAGASMIFSVLQGLVIVLFTGFFLEAYWGNPFVLVAVILLTALISHLMHMIIFLLTKKKGTAEGISQIIVWGMSLLSGMLIPIPDNIIPEPVKIYGSPFSLAIEAIKQSGFIGANTFRLVLCLSLLLLISVALTVSVVLLGRRRSF